MQDDNKQNRFSYYFYNRITYLGVALSLFIFSFELVLYLIDVIIRQHTPYIGLIAYLILPPFLILGLILIPVGALLERRSLRRTGKRVDLHALTIDFTKSTHRNAVIVFIMGTAIFLIASTIGLYQSYHFMESVEFCGQTCHSVMQPEFSAYQDSPHARVKCVECHIGPGAGWFAKSKLSGAYQVYSVLFKKYSKPIQSPVKDLRPARETCEQCHWPKHFFSAKEKVFDHYLADEFNTHWPIRMLVNIGGLRPGSSGHTGIHWHIDANNDIQYIAKDKKRQEIVWVKYVDKGKGQVQEYTLNGEAFVQDDKEELELRHLDCIDCHNRPSHRFLPPDEAVELSLSAGRIDDGIPFIKREAVKALSTQYDSTENALASIQITLHDFYQNQYPDFMKANQTLINTAISEIKKIFHKSQFPEMKLKWDTHTNNISHIKSNGCFRCHGSALETKDGKKIGKDCNTCHTIFSQGPEEKDATTWTVETFHHPVEFGMDPAEMDCVSCHTGIEAFYE
ncbi:MAG: NapC/NirT family cytochrome c [Chlamydiota bacterium]|nr:NapC/NirT family cytochrome c [Chlamydiota bacterium]